MLGIRLFIFKNKYIKPYLSIAGRVINIVLALASLLVIATVTYRYGVNITPEEGSTIHTLLRWLVDFFMLLVALRTGINFMQGVNKLRLPAKIIMGLLYAMLLPMWFGAPKDYFLGMLWELLSNDVYMQVVMVLVTILELSGAVTALLGRKTNPSLIFAVSFLFIICVGAGLLLLPKSTVDGISIIDAFFISTSAVCVTGLTPIEISEVFTPLGTFFILMLIQIGGLGLMTITSFFALFFMGNNSIYNQLAVSDVMSSKSISSLLNTIWRILGFTMFIEGIGFICVWLSIHEKMGMDLHQEIYFSVFHSISAFCNAGFSTLQGNLNNPVLHGNVSILVILSWLIILGGIGFPIFSNFLHIVTYYIRRAIRLLFGRSGKIHREQHLYNLNTKIVIITSALLVVGGTLLMALLEWNHAFDGMTITEKICQAFFNAVTPRTAGYNSLNMDSFSIHSLLLIILLMWIGGASQSTAGGIKVNAFAVAMVNMVSLVRGKPRCEVYSRELSDDSVNRANATIFMSLLMIFSSVFILSLLEPELPLMNLFFEAVSAISTVGLSVNTTPLLGFDAKIIIILLMFIGRIGLITLMLGIVRRSKRNRLIYPKDNIIIN
ncbi:MAG: potassium transporter TrkG [Rikenellaceae bacterium]